MKSAGIQVSNPLRICRLRSEIGRYRAVPYAALLAAVLIAGTVAGCGGYGNGSSGGGGGLSANITNPVSTVQSGATYTFSATTPSSNGYMSGITWTLSPATGAGTLTNVTNNGFTSTVMYQAPATAPNPNSITITATPSDTRVHAATDMFTITASAMAMLEGPIAFEFSGSAGTGESLSAAGSVIADGSGNITGGSIDLNRSFAPSEHLTSVAGAYSLDANLQGRMIITAPGSTRPIEFAFTLGADHQSGLISGSKSSGLVLSGRLIRQDRTAFTLAKISTDFTFKLESNASERVATIGKLAISNNALLSGIADQSRSGADPVMESAAIAGRLNAAPDSNGRATFALTTAAGNSVFVLYVASDSRLLLLETDIGKAARIRQAGFAERQALPFSAATANGAGSLEGMGFEALPSSPGPVSVKGKLTVQNLSHAILSWEAVSATGSMSIDSLRSDAVTFDPSTGRGTIRIANGAANNFADSVTFYLAGPGQGFFLDSTAGQFNRAIAGDLEPAAAK